MFLSADRPLNELPAVSLSHISPPPHHHHHHHHPLTSFVPPSLLRAFCQPFLSLRDSFFYLKSCHSHKVLFLHYNNSFLELLNIYMNPNNVRGDRSVQVSGRWGLELQVGLFCPSLIQDVERFVLILMPLMKNIAGRSGGIDQNQYF